MAFADDREFVGQLLDAYAATAYRFDVALEDPEDRGVPPEMQEGEVDEEGWVAWKMLPSTLAEGDVAAIEEEYKIQFPPLFRAYLATRFHLFDQVKSRRYDQLVFMTATPSHQPLGPITELLSAWSHLIDAGLIPFAQWGDGWGPMCFDITCRIDDGECPVVWLDHEVLVPLGEQQWRQRSAIEPLMQPLYASCREFLLDVFTRTPSA